MTNPARWDAGAYPAWNAARLALLEKYGGRRFFPGKRVLVVGCGDGEIGARLAEWGAEVTCSDGRPEYVETVRNKYLHVLATHVDDLDAADVDLPKADVLIHFGVLYHLRDPAKAIRDAVTAAGYVFLETLVVDLPKYIPWERADESPDGFDQAMWGIACRPSIRFIEDQFRAHGLAFCRIEDPIANTNEHTYAAVGEASAREKFPARAIWMAWQPTLPCPFA